MKKEVQKKVRSKNVIIKAKIVKLVAIRRLLLKLENLGKRINYSKPFLTPRGMWFTMEDMCLLMNMNKKELKELCEKKKVSHTIIRGEIFFQPKDVVRIISKTI